MDVTKVPVGCIRFRISNLIEDSTAQDLIEVFNLPRGQPHGSISVCVRMDLRTRKCSGIAYITVPADLADGIRHKQFVKLQDRPVFIEQISVLQKAGSRAINANTSSIQHCPGKDETSAAGAISSPASAHETAPCTGSTISDEDSWLMKTITKDLKQLIVSMDKKSTGQRGKQRSTYQGDSHGTNTTTKVVKEPKSDKISLDFHIERESNLCLMDHGSDDTSPVVHQSISGNSPNTENCVHNLQEQDQQVSNFQKPLLPETETECQQIVPLVKRVLSPFQVVELSLQEAQHPRQVQSPNPEMQQAQSPQQYQYPSQEAQSSLQQHSFLQQAQQPLQCQSPSEQAQSSQLMDSPSRKAQTPVYQTHSPQTPVYQTHSEQTPVYQTHSPQTPVYQTHSPQRPVYQTHSPQRPVYQTHSQTPVYQTHSEQTPVYRTHSPQTHVYRTQSPLLQKVQSTSPVTKPLSPLSKPFSPVTKSTEPSQSPRLQAIAAEANMSSYAPNQELEKPQGFSASLEQFVALGKLSEHPEQISVLLKLLSVHPQLISAPPQQLSALLRLLASQPQLILAPPDQLSALLKLLTTQPHLLSSPPEQLSILLKLLATQPQLVSAPPQQLSALLNLLTTQPQLIAAPPGQFSVLLLKMLTSQPQLFSAPLGESSLAQTISPTAYHHQIPQDIPVVVVPQQPLVLLPQYNVASQSTLVPNLSNIILPAMMPPQLPHNQLPLVIAQNIPRPETVPNVLQVFPNIP